MFVGEVICMGGGLQTQWDLGFTFGIGVVEDVNMIALTSYIPHFN